MWNRLGLLLLDTLIRELLHRLLVLTQEAQELGAFLIPLAALVSQLTPEPLDIVPKPVALIGEVPLFEGERGKHCTVSEAISPCFIQAHPVSGIRCLKPSQVEGIREYPLQLGGIVGVVALTILTS
jgi:hypothetical protein